MGQLICRPRIESVRESVLDQPCVVLLKFNSIPEENHLQRLDEIDDSEEARREETRRKKKSWRWHSRRKTYNIAKAEKFYQVVTGDNIDDLQEAPISSSGVVFTAEAQVEQEVLQPAVLDMPANPLADDNTDSPVNPTVYESFDSAASPSVYESFDSAASPTVYESFESAVNPAPENDIECAASPKADENIDSSISSAADGDIDAAVNPAPENGIECAASPKADEDIDSSMSSAADGDIDAAVNPASENNIGCAANPKVNRDIDSAWHHTEIQNKNCISHRYTFGEELGRGSFGSVQKGVRIKDGLKVAVKCVQKRSKTKYISTPLYPKPLPLEIALAVIANRAPSCPNIIEVLDWQDDQDHYVMVMEHPPSSMDMRAFLSLNKGALKEHIAQHIMRQVINAVSICCFRGVFHGDIKLSNLLINVKTLEVKLIDFGCGDLMSDSAYKSRRGTQQYISPEYYDTGRYHAKPATVFSLGVLLFTMVNGHYPTDQDKSDLINYFWSKFAVSQECCHFMQSCLRRNPEYRLLLDHMHCHDWSRHTTWRK